MKVLIVFVKIKLFSFQNSPSLRNFCTTYFKSKCRKCLGHSQEGFWLCAWSFSALFVVGIETQHLSEWYEKNDFKE